MRDFRQIPLWQGVAEQDWSDWKWQFANCVTTLEQLDQVVVLTEEERRGVEHATQKLKMRISPHIACLLSPENPADPLRRQFIPSNAEVLSEDDKLLFEDVNADDTYSPVPGLIHRYPTKVLIFPSNYCGSYCRYCFRRKMTRDIERSLNREELARIWPYLEEHDEINEVILSGGDPLVLNDDSLDYILQNVAQIKHIELVRLHTRMVVTVPYRITSGFVSMLAKYKQRFPIFVVIHVDTARELSAPMKEAVGKLVDSGIPCFASCPLLHGVNDTEDELIALWNGLLKLRVKPYYLFHSDPVKGLRHFMVPMRKGLELMRNIYDRMSGLGIPLYCFNVPGGEGHVLLNYNYVTEVGEGRYKVTNFEGKTMIYSEQPD